MTIAERRRQQFFRSKLNEEVEEQTITNEDRSAIAVLAARFTESTIEIMVLADHIENAIIEELDSLAYRKRLKELPCEKS